jgi:thiosulfate/3-mercaptopyruvate sulfurtransferase
MSMLKKVYIYFAGIALLAFLLAPITTLARGPQPSDPWTPAQVISPEALHKLLSEKRGTKPLVIYVGFSVLYNQGHIPGAQYYGQASNPAGLDALKAHVAKLPRSKSIVIYCGCCPWEECPNIRPAFKALKAMGFTRLKALNLPTNLATDWVSKGYPIEKGK